MANSAVRVQLVATGPAGPSFSSIPSIVRLLVVTPQIIGGHFTRHQDTPKADNHNIGTLWFGLPTSSSGGELILTNPALSKDFQPEAGDITIDWSESFPSPSDLPWVFSTGMWYTKSSLFYQVTGSRSPMTFSPPTPFAIVFLESPKDQYSLDGIVQCVERRVEG